MRSHVLHEKSWVVAIFGRAPRPPRDYHATNLKPHHGRKMETQSLQTTRAVTTKRQVPIGTRRGSTGSKFDHGRCVPQRRAPKTLARRCAKGGAGRIMIILLVILPAYDRRSRRMMIILLVILPAYDRRSRRMRIILLVILPVDHGRPGEHLKTLENNGNHCFCMVKTRISENLQCFWWAGRRVLENHGKPWKSLFLYRKNMYFRENTVFLVGGQEST